VSNDEPESARREALSDFIYAMLETGPVEDWGAGSGGSDDTKLALAQQLVEGVWSAWADYQVPYTL